MNEETEAVSLGQTLTELISKLLKMGGEESIIIVDKILKSFGIAPESDKGKKFEQLQEIVRKARTEDEAKIVLKVFQDAGEKEKWDD